MHEFKLVRGPCICDASELIHDFQCSKCPYEAATKLEDKKFYDKWTLRNVILKGQMGQADIRPWQPHEHILFYEVS